MSDETEASPRRPEPRRTREAALTLPLIGLALFSPPLIPLFAGDATVVGVPLIVVYIFMVWAGLIVASRILSHRLAADDPPDGGK